MRKIADLLQVDEIHVFDKNRRIYAGSMPKYYGYTMDSGEQMNFFKPMLEDTSMELCQEITPNTAEGKPMQYAAVWLEDHSAIVQIGMKPSRIPKQIERNELSVVFSLFTVEKGTALFAVDPETYEIIGASKDYMLGEDIRGYGIDVDDMKNENRIYNYNIQGNPVCCIFHPTNTVIIGRILCFIAYYLNKIVVRPIKVINTKLSKIAKGDFGIKIEETSSPEFTDPRTRDPAFE